MFKDKLTEVSVLNISKEMSKLGTPECWRTVHIDASLFENFMAVTGDNYVGLRYGVQLYSTKPLPLKRTIEERLEELEKRLL